MEKHGIKNPSVMNRKKQQKTNYDKVFLDH